MSVSLRKAGRKASMCWGAMTVVLPLVLSNLNKAHATNQITA